MSRKKSFKNSPAMQFISLTEDLVQEETFSPTADEELSAPSNVPKEEPPTNTEEITAEHTKTTEIETDDANTAPAPHNVTNEETPKTPITPLHNAAIPAAPNFSQTPSIAPYPMKKNPIYIETRSKRVQLLMQPTLHAALRETAHMRGISLNDLIHHVMEEFLRADEMGQEESV